MTVDAVELTDADREALAAIERANAARQAAEDAEWQADVIRVDTGGIR